MDFLPGVPISHSPPALVVAENVSGSGAQPADRRGLLDGLHQRLIGSSTAPAVASQPPPARSPAPAPEGLTRARAPLHRPAAAPADPDPAGAVGPAVRLAARPARRARRRPPWASAPPPRRSPAYNELFGLDEPSDVQYLRFLGRAIRLDFGTSARTGRPVTDGVPRALPRHHRADHLRDDLRDRRRHPAGLPRRPQARQLAGLGVGHRLAARRRDPGLLPRLPAAAGLRRRAGLAARLRPAGRAHRRHPHHELLRARRPADPGVGRRLGRLPAPHPARRSRWARSRWRSSSGSPGPRCSTSSTRTTCGRRTRRAWRRRPCGAGTSSATPCCRCRRRSAC